MSTPITVAGERIASCRTMINDVTRLKRSENVFRLLASIHTALTSSLDVRTTVLATAHACVPVLADVCFVDLFEEHPHASQTSRAEVVWSGDVDVTAAFAEHASKSEWRAREAEPHASLTPIFEPASGVALGSLASEICRGRYALHDFELALEIARRTASPSSSSSQHRNRTRTRPTRA